MPKVPPTHRPVPQAPPIPSLTIPLKQTNVAVERQANGDVFLVVGPVLMKFILPFTGEEAKEVGSFLEHAAAGVVPVDIGDLSGISRKL